MYSLLLFAALMSPQQGCVAIPAPLAAAIRQEVGKSRGSTDCRQWIVARGDLDGDGREDVAVVYTIEGSCEGDLPSAPAGSCGNHYEQFLRVWLGNGQLIGAVQVGAKLGDSVAGVTFEGRGKLVLQVLRLAKNDPLCCPSQAAQVQLFLRDDKLQTDRASAALH
jgi:hypothetical protein